MDQPKKPLADEQLLPKATMLDKNSLHAIVKKRANKQKGISMQYFWAVLVLQIIVYALLTNVIIRYWEDTALRTVCLFCFLLYVPFTVVLFRDFKQMAQLGARDDQGSAMPLSNYILEQYRLLRRDYRFKQRYDFLLIAISVAIATWVILRIYFPGGVMAHPILAASIFFPSFFACVAVSRKDEKTHFQEPLKHLESIISDLNDEKV